MRIGELFSIRTHFPKKSLGNKKISNIDDFSKTRYKIPQKIICLEKYSARVTVAI